MTSLGLFGSLWVSLDLLESLWVSLSLSCLSGCFWATLGPSGCVSSLSIIVDHKEVGESASHPTLTVVREPQGFSIIAPDPRVQFK